MVQLAHDAQLVLERQHRGGLLLEPLDGHQLVVGRLSQLYSKLQGQLLGVVACSEGLDDPVLVQIGRYFAFHLIM